MDRTVIIRRRIPALLRAAADIIAARTCPVCGRDLIPGENILCLECLCGLPLTGFWQNPDNPAMLRVQGRILAESVTSLLFFRDGSRFNRLVYQLKYNGRYDIGIFLGKMLGQKIIQTERHPAAGAGAILPVPVHPIRKITRGYNQAEIIAEGLSEATGIPVRKNILRRCALHRSQTSVTMENKWDNVKDSFRATMKTGEESVLLVDDVMTSGSTLEACCTAIRRRDPDVKINIATIAFVE